YQHTRLSPPLTLTPYTTLFRSSLTDWSLSVSSTPMSWTPAPGFTVTAQLTGAITRSDSGVTFEVSATGPTGDLATFTPVDGFTRSEEHTSELQSRGNLVCRLLL